MLASLFFPAICGLYLNVDQVQNADVGDSSIENVTRVPWEPAQYQVVEDLREQSDATVNTEGYSESVHVKHEIPAKKTHTYTTTIIRPVSFSYVSTKIDEMPEDVHGENNASTGILDSDVFGQHARLPEIVETVLPGNQGEISQSPLPAREMSSEELPTPQKVNYTELRPPPPRLQLKRKYGRPHEKVWKLQEKTILKPKNPSKNPRPKRPSHKIKNFENGIHPTTQPSFFSTTSTQVRDDPPLFPPSAGPSVNKNVTHERIYSATQLDQAPDINEDLGESADLRISAKSKTEKKKSEGGSMFKKEQKSHESGNGDKVNKKEAKTEKYSKGHKERKNNDGEYNEETGGKKKYEKREGFHGKQEKGERIKKGAKHGGGKKRKKGHSTHGEHNIVKKDEYIKHTKFYDEEDDDEENREHEEQEDSHEKEESHKEESDNSKESYQNDEKAKKGHHAEGYHDEESIGFDKEDAAESYHSNDEKSINKQGEIYHKKWRKRIYKNGILPT